MYGYVAKRILHAIPIALAVSLVCFLLVHMAPGDPLTLVLPADATQAMIDATKAKYGLDLPLPLQYLLWLWGVVGGDFGTSISTGRPVATEILGAIGYSLSLAALAAVIGFTVGITLGAIAGYTAGTILDRVVSAIAVSGVSVPQYWLGIVLVVIFSVDLGWLPAMGAGDGGALARLHHMILPAVTLAAMPAGIVTRSVRALVAEVLARDFVTALRAKGLGRGAILLHVARNVAPTALAVMGVQLGYLMAGSILVETVFSWPGTGLLLNTAILQRDIPLLQGTILVLALFFVGLNLLVDILQPLVDPRMKRT